MKSSSHCQLLLPGMFRELAESTICPPSLRTLLRFGRKQAVFVGDDFAWRCSRFGVAHQQDTPVAPFAALGDGLQPGGDYWFCADPVHLLLQRDSFIINGAARDHDGPQAAAMVDTLNRHFSGEGMTFFAPSASRWYLRLSKVPDLITTPLSEVVGRNIHPFLPQGGDALLWHKRLNEIQMLLHEHAVNLDLEQQARQPVNSVWIWGGGVLPRGLPQYQLEAWAHDAFTKGLSQAHGGRAASLPFSAEEWLGTDKSGSSHLIVLDQLQLAGLDGFPQAWGEALQRLERHWFAPMLEAVHGGAIERLEMLLAGRHSVQGYLVTRSQLRKFWLRARPFGDYLG